MKEWIQREETKQEIPKWNRKTKGFNASLLGNQRHAELLWHREREREKETANFPISVWIGKMGSAKIKHLGPLWTHLPYFTINFLLS